MDSPRLKQRPPPIKLKESNGGTFLGPFLERAAQKFNHVSGGNDDPKRKSRPAKSPKLPETVTFEQVSTRIFHILRSLLTRGFKLHRDHMPFLNQPFETTPAAVTAIATSHNRTKSSPKASPKTHQAPSIPRVPVPPLSPPLSAASHQSALGSHLPPRTSSLSSPIKVSGRDFHRRASSAEAHFVNNKPDPVSHRSASLSTMGHQRRPSVIPAPIPITPTNLQEDVFAEQAAARPNRNVAIHVCDSNGTTSIDSPLDGGIRIRLSTDVRPQDVDISLKCETITDANGQPSLQWVVSVKPAIGKEAQTPTYSTFESYSLSPPPALTRTPLSSAATARQVSPDRIRTRSPLSPRRPPGAGRGPSSDDGEMWPLSAGSSISSASSNGPTTPRRPRLANGASSGSGSGEDELFMRRQGSSSIAGALMSPSNSSNKEANRKTAILDFAATGPEDFVDAQPMSPKRFGRFISVASPVIAADTDNQDDDDYQTLLAFSRQSLPSDPVAPSPQKSPARMIRHKPSRSDSTIVSPRQPDPQASPRKANLGKRTTIRPAMTAAFVVDRGTATATSESEYDDTDEDNEGGNKTDVSLAEGARLVQARWSKRMMSHWSDTETDVEDAERQKTSWSDVPDATDDDS